MCSLSVKSQPKVGGTLPIPNVSAGFVQPLEHPEGDFFARQTADSGESGKGSVEILNGFFTGRRLSQQLFDQQGAVLHSLGAEDAPARGSFDGVQVAPRDAGAALLIGQSVHGEINMGQFGEKCLPECAVF